MSMDEEGVASIVWKRIGAAIPPIGAGDCNQRIKLRWNGCFLALILYNTSSLVQYNGSILANRK